MPLKARTLPLLLNHEEIWVLSPYLISQESHGHKGSMELRRGGSGNQRVLQTLLLLLLCCTSVERVRCEEVSFVSHGDDLLGVTAVYIDPYPVIPGENVTITVDAFPRIVLLPGSRVTMVVKQKGIPIPTRKYDLCESTTGDASRSIPAGRKTRARFNYPVPSFAFKGGASARVTATDHEGNVITHLTLTLQVGSKHKARRAVTTAAAIPTSSSAFPPRIKVWKVPLRPFKWPRKSL